MSALDDEIRDLIKPLTAAVEVLAAADPAQAGQRLRPLIASTRADEAAQWGRRAEVAAEALDALEPRESMPAAPDPTGRAAPAGVK